MSRALAPEVPARELPHRLFGSDISSKLRITPSVHPEPQGPLRNSLRRTSTRASSENLHCKSERLATLPAVRGSSGLFVALASAFRPVQLAGLVVLSLCFSLWICLLFLFCSLLICFFCCAFSAPPLAVRSLCTCCAVLAWLALVLAASPEVIWPLRSPLAVRCC